MIEFFNNLGGFNSSLFFILGIIFIISEFFISGFFILWFGVSAILTSIICRFYIMELTFQLIIYSILTILLVIIHFVFIVKKITKETDFKDYFLNEKGIGIFKNNMIEYKGTMWMYEYNKNEVFEVKDFDKVTVLKTINNKVIIEKIN